MARIRSIKPGFFTNDQLAEIDPLGRLLFAGLWCHADRAGRLEDRPRKIKAEVLPYDECDVDALLNDLVAHKFIVRYQANGTRYIQVVTFHLHQTPNIKEVQSTIPAPGEHSTPDTPAQYEHSASTVPALHLTDLLTEQEQEQYLEQEGVQGGPPASLPTPLRPEPPPPDGGELPNAAPKPRTLNRQQQSRFDRWYAIYPLKQKRPDAERAWRKLDPNDALTDALMVDIERRIHGRKWAEGYIDHPSTYLNQRVWEDDIEPQRLTPARASPNGKQANGFLAALQRDYGKDGTDEPHDAPAALDATFVVGPAPRRQQPGRH